MPDYGSGGWRELRRSLQPACPKLFYNFTIHGNALDLHITDLVAIWECSLSQPDILKSAKNQHTSIDPSESSSQLQILLQKLGQGLRSDQNQLHHDKNVKSQIVHLKTRVNLPKPLKPLNWSFKLQPQPAAELAEHLLRPCLFEASLSKQKIESLHRVIKEKDHVLSRLLEKIESSSTDLSLIFPGITGFKPKRGRLTVADAEKHIQGMKQFDHNEWMKHFPSDSPYAKYDQRGINNLVSGCEKCPKHTPEEHMSWLERLPENGQKIEESVEQAESDKPYSIEGDKISDNDDTASEDDFERQSTPPSARKRIATHDHTQNNPINVSKDKSNPPSVKKSRLGKLGGASDRKTTAVVSSQIQRSTSAPSMASSTESEHEDELDATHAKSQTRQAHEIKSQQTHSSSQLKRAQSKNDSPSPVHRTQKQSQASTSPKKSFRDMVFTPSPPPHNEFSSPSRRLGKLGSRSKSSGLASPTPDQTTNRASKDRSTVSPRKELSLTPRHRLGRLGRKDSQSQPPTSPARTTHVRDQQQEKRTTSSDQIPDDPDPATTRSRSNKLNYDMTTNEEFDNDITMDLDKDTNRSSTQTPSPSPTPASPKEPSNTYARAFDPKPESSPSPTTRGNTSKNIPRSSVQPSIEEKEETIEEKADRRRLELKRQTEVQAGVRKKRKF